MRYSKSGEGDFFNHYKTHLLEQFKIQLLCSGPRQFPNMDINDVKQLTLSLTYNFKIHFLGLERNNIRSPGLQSSRLCHNLATIKHLEILRN